MNSTIKNTAIVTGLSLATRGLSFIYKIILSRSLTTYDLGTYHIVFTLFMVLICITSSGLPLFISKTAATCGLRTLSANTNSIDKLIIRNRNQAFKSNSIATATTYEVVSSSIFFCLGFSVFACILVFTFKDVLAQLLGGIAGYDMLLTLLPALVASAFYSSFRGYLWGKKKFFTFSFIELIEELLTVIFLISFIYFFKDIEKLTLVSYAITLSYVVAAGISTSCYLVSNGKLTKPSKKIMSAIRGAAPVTLVRLLSTSLSSVISLILPALLLLYGLNKQDALSLIGVISGMAMPLVFLPSSLIGSLALVLVPEVTANMTLKKMNKVQDAVYYSFSFSAIIACFIIPIFFLFGKEVCQFLYANITAGEYLTFASMIMLPLSLNQMASTILNSVGGERYIIYTFISTAAISLITVLGLTPIIGIYSMLVSSFLQLSFGFILNCVFINKITKIKLSKLTKPALNIFLIVPPIIIVSLLKKFVHFDNLFVYLMVFCFIALLLTLAFLYLFNGKLLGKIKSQLKI